MPRTLLPSRRTPVRVSLRGAILLVAALSGCSGTGESTIATHAVKGKVLLASGRPLTAGRVVFVAKDGLTLPASGPIGSDGSFTLTTRSEGDGAIAGDYKVRIEAAQAAARRPGRAPGFPLKYVDEDSSGLLVTVRAETNQLEPIRLK
jgi:hypothetical protein